MVRRSLARLVLRSFCAVSVIGVPVFGDRPGDVGSGIAESAPPLRPAAPVNVQANVVDDWHLGDFEPMPLCRPDLLQIPNQPGGTTPLFERYDAATGDVIPFEPGDPVYFPDTSTPPPGIQWIMEEGRGEDGPEVPELEADRNFSAPLVLVNDPSPWPYRPNCKLFMRFQNAGGTVANLVCSGTLIDSRHVVTAGHCVYAHTLRIGPPAVPGGPPTPVVFNTWASSIRVVPAKNNADEPYCYADMTTMTSYTCWTLPRNQGGENYDCDLAILFIDRPVGALTGWFGYGTRPNCSGYTGGSEQFFNRGYPAAAPYNGLQMWDQDGNFDSCETNFFGNWTGNEVTMNRQSWGGQSGSSAYKFVNNSRTILAILSNGTDPPNARTSYACVESQTFNQWRNTINGNTPANPDRIPMNTRADAQQVAGRRVSGVNFLIHNYASAASAGICNFDLYMSLDQVIDPANDTLLGSGRFNANIGVKASMRLNYSNSPPFIPANTVPRTYYLGVVLTTGDANNGNNVVHVCDVAQIQVKAIGACCLPNGTCTPDQTPAQCNAAGGVYQGNGTACVPNPCPIVQGACCGSSGFCFVATSTECTQNGGVYFGDFSSCGAVGQCPNAGACCNEAGECRIASAIACAGPGEQYRGNGTNCAPNPCAPASQPVMGACCDPGNTCALLSQGDCALIGGTFQGAGTDCNTAPCAVPTGACCITAVCIQATDLDCFFNGGDYLGDNSACPPVCGGTAPSGACCDNVNGTCVIQTQPLCVSGGGTYMGSGVPCEPFPCAATIGACCMADGSCREQSAAACANDGGAYLGNGSTCEPNLCQQPATGACCTFVGGCFVSSAVGCAAENGTYFGDGTTCDPNPCPQPGFGGCCFADGACQFVSRLECLATSSFYYGDNVACPDGPCAGITGACCDASGACSLRTRVVCEGTGGRYMGDGSACAGPTCGGGLGDMNCDGRVTVSDIGPFVLALTDPPGYLAAFPNCFILNGDFSRDANVSPADIAGFVNAIVGQAADAGGG